MKTRLPVPMPAQASAYRSVMAAAYAHLKPWISNHVPNPHPKKRNVQHGDGDGAGNQLHGDQPENGRGGD